MILATSVYCTYWLIFESFEDVGIGGPEETAFADPGNLPVHSRGL
jgi:hypothetical protein